MIIHHITLLTGHVSTHRLDTLDTAAVEACRALLPSGGHVPGFPAFRVEIHGPVFTLYRGREPIVTCGTGRGENDAWRALVDLQSKFGAVKASAPAGLWLAVVLLPGLTLQSQNDIAWIGDFERCLAAAILLP